MPRKSKNLPRTKPRIQERAGDKAEKKNPYERLQENSNLQAFFFQTPFLTATLPTTKTLGGGTPPQGGFNPPPYGVGVRDKHTRSSNHSSHPPSGFFFSEVLVFPLLNPPPVASGRLHLLRRSAALARLGASWAKKIAFQEAFKN